MFDSIASATKALWLKRMGGSQAQLETIDYAFGNNTPLKWRNAADTADVEVLNVDADGSIVLNGITSTPSTHPITFRMAANGSLASQQFFIVPFACKVVGIKEVHATAGNDAGAVTAYIEKLSSTTAVGSGTALHTALSMKATANTVQTATLSTASPKMDGTSAVLDLAVGDRLAIVFAGTLTTLAGVVFTISVTPAFKAETVRWAMHANGSLADASVFVANRPCIVTGAYYVHSVKGTNGSAVNLQIVKDTSTDAPGAGTDILTNNTNAGFDCKGANYTVQTGTLTATAATLRLAVGDRLSLDFAGTLTALAGVVVVVVLQPLAPRFEVGWDMVANGSLADQAFFIADRSYEVLDVREVHATAGNDGGAVTLQVTIDSATDAPGAGVNLLTDNTNAGFDLKGTANTVQAGTLGALGTRYLLSGDRLSVDFAGTLTTLAGVTVTTTLKPV